MSVFAPKKKPTDPFYQAVEQFYRQHGCGYMLDANPLVDPTSYKAGRMLMAMEEEEIQAWFGDDYEDDGGMW